jgi:histone deacetylase complex regulatory component SIN3
MYGSPHFYVQLKLIATIYERLQKAQTLLQDDPEKYDMFVSTVLLMIVNDRKLEQFAYEDLLRTLMGKDAYLLFIFDRLLSAVSWVDFTVDFEEPC